MLERKFERGQLKNRSLEEKNELCKLCKKQKCIWFLKRILDNKKQT